MKNDDPWPLLPRLVSLPRLVKMISELAAREPDFVDCLSRVESLLARETLYGQLKQDFVEQILRREDDFISAADTKSLIAEIDDAILSEILSLGRKFELDLQEEMRVIAKFFRKTSCEKN